MASDITLAVGDGARHMTYDELAQGRGILLASAPFVPRAISRNSAETPDFSDPGPAEAVSYGTRPMPAADSLEPGPGTEPTSVADGPGADPLTVIAIQTLSQAVEMLRRSEQTFLLRRGTEGSNPSPSSGESANIGSRNTRSSVTEPSSLLRAAEAVLASVLEL